jgi:small-conductance mechanosensitive channel
LDVAEGGIVQATLPLESGLGGGMQAIRVILMNHPMQLAWPAIVFAAVLGAGWLVRWLVLRALRSWTRRTGSRPGLILDEALRGPLLIWAVILAVHTAIQLSGLPEKATEWGAQLLLVLWIASLTLMCMRFAGNLVRHYGDQVPGALPVTTLSRNLAQLAVLILGVVWLLAAFHLNITPILAALGVGGLAVALALQDTLSNLFSGFYVTVARQVRLGDYIKLNTGEAGYVTDIGWRATSIRELANNLIVVPNSKLAQAIVTNYHLPERRMSASLQVAVSCDSDPDRVEDVLADVARQAIGEIPGLLGDPAPGASFDPGFGESSLGFTLYFQVAEFAQQFGVRNELRKRVLRRFREEGIAIPFPSRTVYVREEKAAVEKPPGPHD